MKLHHLVLGAALAASLPTAAFAAEGVYLGVGAGVNFLRDADTSFTGPAPLAAESRSLDFNTGFAGTLTAGYAFGFGLRTEAELGMRRNRLDNFGGADANDGAFRSLSVMGNVLYDIPTGTAFTPYLGGGVGFARVKADSVQNAGVTRSVDDSDTRFAYQGIVGVSYAVNDNLSFSVDYRYFGTSDPDFNATGGGYTRADSEYRNHTILAGLRYTFTAAPSVPPPPPEQVVMQREFLVFFDFDKYSITPIASQTIADAAATAGATRTIRLDVVGHTDTSGSPSYNMRLSQRRAEMVKKELVKRGVPASNVTIAWRGEAQPMVATADGVREPSNRRASITLVIQ